MSETALAALSLIFLLLVLIIGFVKKSIWAILPWAQL